MCRPLVELIYVPVKWWIHSQHNKNPFNSDSRLNFRHQIFIFWHVKLNLLMTDNWFQTQNTKWETQTLASSWTGVNVHVWNFSSFDGVECPSNTNFVLDQYTICNYKNKHLSQSIPRTSFTPDVLSPHFAMLMISPLGICKRKFSTNTCLLFHNPM